MNTDAMVQPSAPAIVIAGMHRSGTSLAASLVASAGVHLGERLMGPERGNVKGHFEDLDFYDLHQRALAAAGLGPEGFTLLPSILVPPAVDDAFDALVAKRRGAGRLWGWKDPRTTLFLDAWCEKLPEARFLLVFRRPWEVIDSLFRRGDAAFALNPRLAADVWASYNRRIHDFFLAHRDRCLLVEAAQLARDPGGVIASVGRLAGADLPCPEDLYDPALLVEDDSFDRKQLVSRMRPDAMDLYEALRGLVGGQSASSPARSSARHDDLVDAASMQWVRAARAEQLARGREAALAAETRVLAAVRTERDDLARRLDGLARTLEAASVEASALRSQLDAAACENASLAQQLAVARRRKTVLERLARESRRVVQQACGLIGLTWVSAAARRS